MTVILFLKGFVVGVLIGAPVGPAGMLCIHRTLQRGRLYGLISGLGAATADAFFGCIAAFGLTMISNFLVAEHLWFRLLGGGFLCFLGCKDYLAHPTAATLPEERLSYVGTYGSGVFVTLMSPTTVIGCMALFAGLGLVSSHVHYLPASIIVAGIFAGSGIWWVILSYATHHFRGKFENGNLGRINKIAGITIGAVGILAILSAIIPGYIQFLK